MATLRAIAAVALAATAVATGQSAGGSSASPIASTNNLTVDLGYAVYQGSPQGSVNNSPKGLINAWLGIRYAAPPVGDNRWRAPQDPPKNRSKTIVANSYGPQCPQTPQSPLPSGYPYQGDEDCLFLNVWAPEGASKLPVMVYIHGGGYGAGNGQFNVTQAPLQNASSNGIVTVAIQYRLEAFGFLASPDIKSDGSLNAGLLDQYFALEWTKKYISLFGGDPSRVTLVGESAGAGSVMVQTMAYGGEDGTRLFQQGIAASPYAPVQYNYSDAVPIQRFGRFAKQAGCAEKGNSTLSCLRAADTNTLQKANADVGAGINYGSWAFIPVTDGEFLRDVPSSQLTSGKMNGQRILTGNNADEGAQFVNPNLTTNADFGRWLRTEYPLLTKSDIHKINTIYYPPRDVGDTPYASCGDCGGATAVNVGSFAVGPEQRAINLYSEVTFDCPSIWLAEGMTRNSGEGYKYQFSVIPSFHGFDLGADGFSACPSFLTPEIAPSMCVALTQAWANFITTGDPSITNAIANGNSSAPAMQNPASHWPPFKPTGSHAYQMLNFNQSGGTLYTTPQPLITGLGNVTVYVEPGLQNNISKVNGYDWEGGRGERCAFWRSLGYPS